MSTEPDRPATRRDLREAFTELKQYILDREIGLMWKFLLLELALLGAQWAAISWMMQHWKP